MDSHLNKFEGSEDQIRRAAEITALQSSYIYRIVRL